MPASAAVNMLLPPPTASTACKQSPRQMQSLRLTFRSDETFPVRTLRRSQEAPRWLQQDPGKPRQHGRLNRLGKRQMELNNPPGLAPWHAARKGMPHSKWHIARTVLQSRRGWHSSRPAPPDVRPAGRQYRWTGAHFNSKAYDHCQKHLGYCTRAGDKLRDSTRVCMSRPPPLRLSPFTGATTIATDRHCHYRQCLHHPAR